MILNLIFPLPLLPKGTFLLPPKFLGCIEISLKHSNKKSFFFKYSHNRTKNCLCAADPLGAVVGQIATPYLVKSTADIPFNNYVWVGLAVFSQVVCWASVNRWVGNIIK